MTERKPILQFRPSTTENLDNPMYSPHRDMGHVGPHMIYNALHLLEPENQDDALADFLASADVTSDMLVAAIVKLRETFELFPEGQKIEDAMREAGYLDTPASARIAIERCIGRLFLAAVWLGIKDVTVPGKRPRSVQEVINAISAQLGMEE